MENVNKNCVVLVKIFHYRSHLKNKRKEKSCQKNAKKRIKKLLKKLLLLPKVTKKIVVNGHIPFSNVLFMVDQSRKTMAK